MSKNQAAGAAGQSVSALASVAPDKGTMKRSIQMGFFLAPDEIVDGKARTQKEVVAFTKTAATLGQVAGVIYATRRQTNDIKGEMVESIAAVGKFEAVNYATGEVIESTTAFLPKYYLETAEAILARGATMIVLGVEVVLVPTGKNIPVAYELRDLAPATADDPLNRVKAALAANGRLRLTAPVELPDAAPLLAAPTQEALPAPDEPQP